MSLPDPNTLLTKAEAKAKLGNISDGVLRRLIRQGKLRAVKYGVTTPLRFRALDVERCIENLLTPGPDLSHLAAPSHVASPVAAPGNAGKDGSR
jgi:hypothetical protein